MSESAGADDLVSRLFELVSGDGAITVFIGSGVTGTAIPRRTGVLDLADEYAANRPSGSRLVDALRRVRSRRANSEVAALLDYRREFAKWVSGDEFDVVAQEAVLRAYRPADPDLLSSRGRWKRVEAALGERLEADVDSWAVPDGLAALGALLVHRRDAFPNGLLTTNIDPLAEIAVMRAGAGATSVALSADGSGHPLNPAENSIPVYHLHGYWRPDQEAGRERLLHDPEHLAEHRPALAAQVEKLIHSDTVLVLGHSGWDRILELTLRRITERDRPLTVLWAEHSPDEQHARQQKDRLTALLTNNWPSDNPPVVHVFHGVDSDSVLPELARRLELPVAQRVATARRHRHPRWERELISEAGTRPPQDALDLLRQLDRRYQWERSWTDRPPPPTLLFWPVRLRPSPSVIHMTQALAAAALSARRTKVVVCIDDYHVNDREACTERFSRDVERWFRRVPDSNPPTFVSLEEHIELSEDSPMLRRSTRPWDVAQRVLGERNPSVLSILMAAKIIRDIPLDEVADNAKEIVSELGRQNARRLLTPLTLWSHLNDLLARHQVPTGSVLTLCGREERSLWKLWKEIYDHGVQQVYNPQLLNLNNQALMLRWSKPEELRTYLVEQLEHDDWHEPGQYFQWLVQNAFLLPAYLAGEPSATFHGLRLDSWQAVREAVRKDRSVLDEIVNRVCAVYLD